MVASEYAGPRCACAYLLGGNNIPAFAALEALASRPDVDARTRGRIQSELRTMQAGIKGEKDAAYQIELYFGRSENWVTLHDFRIEVGEFVAQIDHLLMNRLGEIWVCESKTLAEGVSVNDRGEWVRYSRGRPEGMASPIEQNRQHIFLLDRAFSDGLLPKPRRFGLVSMKPELRSLVLMSNDSRISRPRRRMPELDQVMKVEKLKNFVSDAFDKSPLPKATRLMGSKGLLDFGKQLAARHQPAHWNWSARFGLADAVAEADQSPPSIATTRAQGPTRRSGHHCAECGADVSFAVVRFCWNNADRFGGKIYCYNDQQKFPARAQL